MSLCALCAVVTTGDAELCTHHHAVKRDDWADGNRVMCDFLHRGIIIGPDAPSATETSIPADALGFAPAEHYFDAA